MNFNKEKFQEVCGITTLVRLKDELDCSEPTIRRKIRHPEDYLTMGDFLAICRFLHQNPTDFFMENTDATLPRQ